MLTQTRLKELLNYNPETGLFFWNKIQRKCTNKEAGCTDSNGYRCIKIDYKVYKTHRLAWLYVYGVWPEGVIDHINHVRDDNRIANLRDVDEVTNGQNQIVAQKHNKLGLLGVCQRGKRFAAFIRINKKNIYLGTYSTPEMAHQVYLEFKQKYHSGNTI